MNLKKKDYEREISLKQLQINRLLEITTAVNHDVDEASLLNMYKKFLSWEMGVSRMAFFLPKGEDWECVTHIGLNEDNIRKIPKHLPAKFNQLGFEQKKLDNEKEEFWEIFEYVIPIVHRESPIGYTFLNEYGSDDFGKIQLILSISNIVAVSIENKRRFSRQLEEARFEHEMQLASEMQLALVPQILPQSDFFELSSIYKPHFGVGGDYFDCVKISDTRYILCVADVAGKGLAAALLMSNIEASLHAIVQNAGTLEQYVQRLNKAVWRVTKGDRYVTSFIVDLDTENRTLKYINAGHIPPAFHSNGTLQWLDKGCAILGYFKELPHIESDTINITDDAYLLIFTDGITDIKNNAGEFFDELMLGDLVCENNHLSAEQFNKNLMQKAETFKGDMDFPDDITVLTCKFKAPVLV